MFEPDGANRLRGENLWHLIEEVRYQFFSQSPETNRTRYRQASSARIVTIEVYAGLSFESRVAIVADLMRASEEMVLSRDARDVFAHSDTPQAYITDLVCEVVYQELMRDPEVIMEDESRAAMLKP